jgi:hypothetical protein
VCFNSIPYSSLQVVCFEALSAKHQIGKAGTCRQQLLPAQDTDEHDDLATRVAASFLAADIPLHKLRHPAVKSLFEFLGHRAPSYSACRSRLPNLSNLEQSRLVQRLKDKELFLVVDEAEISGTKFINCLVGDIKEPTVTYLLLCKICPGPANQQSIIHVVDDAVKTLGADRRNVVLLLSDAARYMTAAGNVLRQLYPRLFHVTCAAHLLHNCAEKVRAYFSDVDAAIAAVKASTVKNKDRKELFADIGYPPQPVLTRWATWLDAAMYYANNLPRVREIVGSFQGTGMLVRRAKEAVEAPSLCASLVAIKQYYGILGQIVRKSESTSYSIANAYQDLTTLSFGADPCGVTAYINRRIQQNTGLIDISLLRRPEISPTLYAALRSCQATSVSVERTFSKLKKLLAKDRNFATENVGKYLQLFCNSASADA